jgi:uncharacterized GH25 family protein
MSGRRIAISLALAALVSTGAAAHSPYLLPNQFDLSDRDHVSVQASFTEEFFVPDVVMKGDQWHVVGPQGASVPLAPVYTRDLAILDVDTPQPGTYRISSGSRDGRVAKATIEKGEWKFLRGNDAPPAGAKVYEIKSITRAEVYVTRGAANDAALAPAKQGLEFQLLTHPGKWLVGGDTRLRVLFDGKPVPNGSLTLRRANTPESAEKTLTSDADGVVKLSFAEAGLYHAQLRHRFIVPGSEARAESHTYALTLDVGE